MIAWFFTVALASTPLECRETPLDCVEAARATNDLDERFRFNVYACLAGERLGCMGVAEETVRSRRDDRTAHDRATRWYRRTCDVADSGACYYPASLYAALGPDSYPQAANHASFGCSRGAREYCDLGLELELQLGVEIPEDEVQRRREANPLYGLFDLSDISTNAGVMRHTAFLDNLPGPYHLEPAH